MRERITLPAILYLAILDRLGDGWTYGALHYVEAYPHYEHTLELAAGIAQMHHKAQPRCAVKLA